IKLEQNYRSTGTILKVAGAVVKNNIERKGKTLWTDNDAGDAVCCRSAESPREEARLIAGHIKKLLKENPEWRVAILYRANFLSRNFEDVLTEEGIPYAVVGSVAFFGRMEVKDLLAHLRIIFNPEDDIALLRIFNTPPKGIGSATIDFLTEAAINKGIPILRALRELIGDGQVPNRAVGALTRFLELVDRWTAVRETLTTAKLLETILGDIRYREMLEKRETAAEAENRMANIQELIQAAAESEQRGETVGDFLDRASLSSDLDQLNPDARVALMTLHSAKGLEFDAVFMAGMEEGLFPHVQSTASDADLEEERRLCYVGITRARQKLFLTWTPFRKNYGPQAYSPAHISRFLEEMPPDLVEGMEAGLESAAEVTDRWNRISNRFGETSGSCRQGFPKKQVRDFEMPADQPKSIAEIKAYLQQHHQKSAATAGMESKSAPVLKAGARVRHDQFGEGIILSRERMGNEIKLVITFSRVGKKSLVEKYAKLKAI
ncbi:MAG TPA: 3'-5' exonuclease, partial [Acidobacteriota bacterium]|nr:3'-5' exonuclease [Acidobacteriota bacterium]